MYYEVYIDSIFLMNFVLNLFLLTLTARTLNRTATRLRIMAGSAAGALLYCIILVLPIGYTVKTLIGLIPASIGMSKLTFGSKGIKTVLRETGYLFGYGFILGSLILYIFRRFTFLNRLSGKIWGVLGMAYLSFAVLDFLLKKHRKRKADPFCLVTIPCGDKAVTVTALIDTGNGLREPVSGKPVSILEETVWEQLRPLMRAEKLKVIPYHSIGNPHGMMEGYELTGIRVKREDVEWCLERVIVGVCKEQVSAGKQYQMILHPELF